MDATADQIITEAYLPGLKHHQIDVRQLAVVSQVYDRTGSNSFWNNKVALEQQNLSDASYDPQHNDIALLIAILNEWVKLEKAHCWSGIKIYVNTCGVIPSLMKVSP